MARDFWLLHDFTPSGTACKSLHVQLRLNTMMTVPWCHLADRDKEWQVPPSWCADTGQSSAR
jgi:hypothetical protein